MPERGRRLIDLTGALADGMWSYVFPLKVVGSSGSPCRAVAAEP